MTQSPIGKLIEDVLKNGKDASKRPWIKHGLLLGVKHHTGIKTVANFCTQQEFNGWPLEIDAQNLKFSLVSANSAETLALALIAAIGALKTGIGYEPLNSLEPRIFSETLERINNMVVK